jgi:hypothetical protein
MCFLMPVTITIKMGRAGSKRVTTQHHPCRSRQIQMKRAGRILNEPGLMRASNGQSDTEDMFGQLAC